MRERDDRFQLRDINYRRFVVRFFSTIISRGRRGRHDCKVITILQKCVTRLKTYSPHARQSNGD